jgi:hypothetical protein
MLWLLRDVVVPVGCGGSCGLWWLLWDVVALVRCGGSCGMWWHLWDMVAPMGCEGTRGMCRRKYYRTLQKKPNEAPNDPQGVHSFLHSDFFFVFSLHKVKI